MKILIFAEVYYPDVMGGGEFSTKQMAEGMIKKGHDVVVYCLGMRTKEEEINGVCVKRKYVKGLSEHFVSNTKNNRIADPYSQFDKIVRKYGDLYPCKKRYLLYRSIIIKEDPEVVHTVSPMSYLGRFNLWKAAYDLDIPVSHVARGPNLLKLKFLGGVFDGFNRSRNAKASFFLTALAAPSSYMLNCHNRYGIKGQRFNEVIYNSVDFERVIVSEEMVEKKENIVLYAGEIRKEKGVDTLIQAVCGIDNARLFLIGRGELADSIKITDKVQVIDWMDREELYKYMRCVKVVVLPSVWNEPFGRVLIESVNNGTIAIGSDKGGIPEALGFNGDYIFHSRDRDDLEKRIERVINMSAAAYVEEVTKQQKVAAGFDNNTYVDNWERFFLQQL